MFHLLRIGIAAILGVILIGGGLYLFSAEQQDLRDRIRANLVRAEHRTQYRLGVPLSGTPELANLDARLSAQGLKLGAPVMIRIFKLDSELELWMQKDGRYQLFATYPICRWSGRLGPKLRQGDGQAPEGFYTVAKEQLNPNSRWLRSFNLGFPNAYDTALGRTGTFLMVHGGCGSVGCYAMTNPVIAEIWQIVTAALDAGQPRFQVEIFPFRMTNADLAARAGNQWSPFWAELKKGYDLFEASHIPPSVSVCRNHYAFEAGTLASASSEIAQRCPSTLADNP